MEQYVEETKEERKQRIQAEKKRLKHLLRIVALFVLILAVLVVALCVQLVRSRFSEGGVGTEVAEDAEFSFTYVGDEAAENGEEGASTPAISLPVPEVKGDALYSDYALMVRASDSAVVFDKAGSEMMFPASMTKMMTVLVALDADIDLRTQITVTQENIDAGYIAGAAMAGFEAGETVTAEELMYGTILASGADACLALAGEICEKPEEFVERMNAKAQELGMTNTHFMNPTGLHDPEHYSTCADIAILMKACMEKNTFRRIISTPTYTTEPTAQHPDGLTIRSTLFEVLVNNVLNNGVVIQGGKTGTTDEAQNCLASYATAGNETYYLITAHAADNAETSHPNISDAVTMYEQLPSVSG